MENRLNPFITTYMKDYTEKPTKRRIKYTKHQEFQDPVSEGFKHYLVLDETKITAPKEDGEQYLETFKEKHPKIGIVHFKEPLQKDVIFMNKMTQAVSEYQTRYCDIIKDIEYYKERRKKKVELPDTIDIPATTYRALFRKPAALCPQALDGPLIIIPPTTLGVNEKMNDIVGVKTGITEYMDDIGRWGEFIVKEQMHGPIRH